MVMGGISSQAGGSDGPQRMDTAMVEVLDKLRSITDHLRKIHSDEPANKISKSVHQIFKDFGDATAGLTDYEMWMVPSVDESNLLNDHDDEEFSRNEYQRMLKGICQPRNGDLVPIHYPIPDPPARLWSSVAAAPPQAHINKNRPLIDASSKRRNKRPTPIVPIHPGGRIIQAPNPAQREQNKKAGVLIVEGKFNIHSLNFLTARIHEGPLYSVEIVHNTGYAEITFLHAQHASNFLIEDKLATEKTGYGRFGPDFKVRYDRCLVRDWDGDLENMDKPMLNKERRRLTFVRSRLLAYPCTFERLTDDIMRIAGEDGVDFIWKFNAGNVTAAFKSVKTARHVREMFWQKSSEPGPYAGVQVTYSTDPCEKPLHLRRA
ncbi:hypothetical protein PABG_01065 [Paracoccidioides brasiliensis Pb03]|nr:hypothetical protein PABG_01065 [Paracoccidioides brasiliensis Pb03]